MPKKIIAVLLLVVFSCSLFALDMSNAREYEDSEFPKWALELRRAETIFFGGIPLVYPFAYLAVDTLNGNTDFWNVMAITCAVTATISVVDFIIGLGE
ncbi:MAG: hypothetical protein K6F82_02060 [Sphaerochaetaceae bacterium]|nr:hypothetical protein [Sphaerochaetaceae bacterium]